MIYFKIKVIIIKKKLLVKKRLKYQSKLRVSLIGKNLVGKEWCNFRFVDIWKKRTLQRHLQIV